MDDGFDITRLCYVGQQGSVTDVSFDEIKASPGSELCDVEAFQFRVIVGGKGIEAYDSLAAIEETLTDVATYKSGTAGNEHIPAHERFLN
jgi:hypothetical protein